MRGDRFPQLLVDLLRDPEQAYPRLTLVLQATRLREVGPQLDAQSRAELGLSMAECALTTAQLHTVSAVLGAYLEEESDAPSRWLLSALVYLDDDRAVPVVVRLLERRLTRAPGWADVDPHLLLNCYLAVFVHERPHPVAERAWARLVDSDDPEVRAAVVASTPV